MCRYFLSFLLVFVPLRTFSQTSFVYQKVVKENVCYRVYNRPNDGFDIVAGDNPQGCLLARIDHGKFNIDSIPENMAWLLEQYVEQISLKKNTIMPIRRQKASERSIQPLITSQWGQEYPFNQAIPYNKTRYLTGCVATAMGQVMRFHRHPGKGSGRTAQTVDGLPFTADFSTTNYGFWKMKDRYDAGQYSDDQAEAMSTLLFHAGMGVSMSYGTNGSGAMVSLVPRCLTSNFGYDKAITYESRKYYSDEEWHELLYNELNEGRPIIYRGSNVNDESRQHCFVCDGYDASTGLFHFNWGWSGSCDGYFALTGSTALDGPTFNYGNSQCVVIGIKPAQSNDDNSVSRLSASSVQMKVKIESDKTPKAYSYYVIGDNLSALPSISLTASVRNSGLLSNPLRIGIRMTHIASGEVRYIAGELSPNLAYSVLKTVNANLDLSDVQGLTGTYSLELVVRPSNSTSDEEWQPVHLAPGIDMPRLQFGGVDDSQMSQDKTDDTKVENKASVVASQIYTIEREAGKGNTWSRIEYDESAICQALGVSAILSDMLFPIRSTTDELLSNGMEYDGWFDANGDPIAYARSTDVSINVPAPSNGVMRLHTNPFGELQVGDSVHARWAFVNGDKMATVDVIVKITASQKPENQSAQDYTYYINNPDFTDNDLSGWEGDPWSQYFGDENAEHFSWIYNTYQEIQGLPKGIYLLEVDALDRMGSYELAVSCYNEDTIVGNRALLYARTSEGYFQTAVRQLMDGAGSAPLGIGREVSVLDRNGNTCYVPDDMQSAAAYFKEGRYRNGVYFRVGDDGVLTLGVSNKLSGWSYLPDNWTCVDNFRLTYFGEDYTEHYPGESIHSVRSNQIVNPNYDGCDVYTGWLGNLMQYWENPVGAYNEQERIAVDQYQYLSGLTPGKYLLEVDGMYTFAHMEYDGWYYWIMGTSRAETNIGTLYARSSLGQFEVPLTRTCYGIKSDSTYNDIYYETMWHSGYLPDQIWDHIPHVTDECYKNGMYVEVGEDGELKIGVHETENPCVDRMVVDNWRLTYLGSSHPAASGADKYGFRKQFDTFDEYKAYQQKVDDFLSDPQGAEYMDFTEILHYPNFNYWDQTGMESWWNGNPTIKYGCAEKWNCTFDVYQDVQTLPAGYYELRCQGFYRYNTTDENTNAIAVQAHADGTEKLCAYFYANNHEVPLPSIVADMSLFDSDPSTQGYYYFHNEFESGLPFAMEHASVAFSDGLYDDNVLRFYLNGYEPLRFGIRKSEYPGCDWTIFRNFRLHYYGPTAPEGFEIGISDLPATRPFAPAVFDLMGRKHRSLLPGLNIVNGKIIMNNY